MCIFHKWEPCLKVVPRHWVQFHKLIVPSLFAGPPYLLDVPGVGYWSTNKIDGYRCTKCGKLKGVN